MDTLERNATSNNRQATMDAGDRTAVGQPEAVDSERYSFEERVVFCVLVGWRSERGVTVECEYERVKGRLPVGSVLYMGSVRRDGALSCDAVVLLRKKLATVGELCTWFGIARESGVSVPLKGKGELGKFVRVTQEYCSREGRLTCGERIELQGGDAKTQREVEVPRWYGEKAVGLLTARMEGYQNDAEAEATATVRDTYLRLLRLLVVDETSGLISMEDILSQDGMNKMK
jgi:hypothetical protein